MCLIHKLARVGRIVMLGKNCHEQGRESPLSRQLLVHIGIGQAEHVMYGFAQTLVFKL